MPGKARTYTPLPFGNKLWLACGLVLLGLLSQQTLLAREQSTQGTSTNTNGVSRTISVPDAPSGPGITTYDERKVTVSPASSKTNLEFTSEFDKVFPSSSLHTTFKRHPAFGAVYAVALLFGRLVRLFPCGFHSAQARGLIPLSPPGIPSCLAMLCASSWHLGIVYHSLTLRSLSTIPSLRSQRVHLA